MNERGIRSLYVILGLQVGGAERHASNLPQRVNPARFTPSSWAGRHHVEAELNLDCSVAAPEHAIEEVVSEDPGNHDGEPRP